MSSFFYLQVEKNQKNHKLIDSVSTYCEQNKVQAYLIDHPLGDTKYTYEYKDALVLLIPKHKITFITFSGSTQKFEDYVDDFIEDLGSISDKYRYKNSIGRPKSWRVDLTTTISHEEIIDFENFLDSIKIENTNNRTTSKSIGELSVRD